jgi:drug/metabolite transporter (DMT)-like permease
LFLSGVPVLHGRPGAILWLGALVIVTTVAGHGLLNLAARHVGLFTVNLVIVLEPVLAIALGAALFGATVGTLTALGGALLIVAVLVGMRPARV